MAARQTPGKLPASAFGAFELERLPVRSRGFVGLCVDPSRLILTHSDLDTRAQAAPVIKKHSLITLETA